MTLRTGLTILLLAQGIPLAADHFPENLRASDPPDRELAGVTVMPAAGADLSTVVRAFGPPMNYLESSSKAGPVRGGEAEYLWRRAGVEIKANTVWHFDDQGRRVETVVACAISGSKSSAPLCSARGVCLGDTANTLEQRYGSKFQRDRVSDHDAIRFQFKDDTILEFDLTKSGAVDRIALSALVE